MSDIIKDKSKRLAMPICPKCQKDTALTRKYGLCVNCSANLRNKIKRASKPSLKRIDFIMNLGDKHGQQVFKDIDTLKTQPFFNLAAFGRKYNLSREMARQIFKKYFYGESIRKYQRLKKRMMQDDFKNMACEMHPKAKIAECTGSRYITHTRIVLDVFNICNTEMEGYAVTFDKKAKCDMVINGHKVLVRSSNCSSISNKNYSNGIQYWKFNTRHKNKFDFIILYLVAQNEYYIVPAKEIIGDMTYIPKDKENRLDKYLDRWELLKIKEK